MYQSDTFGPARDINRDLQKKNYGFWTFHELSVLWNNWTWQFVDVKNQIFRIFFVFGQNLVMTDFWSHWNFKKNSVKFRKFKEFSWIHIKLVKNTSTNFDTILWMCREVIWKWFSNIFKVLKALLTDVSWTDV